MAAKISSLESQDVEIISFLGRIAGTKKDYQPSTSYSHSYYENHWYTPLYHPYYYSSDCSCRCRPKKHKGDNKKEDSQIIFLAVVVGIAAITSGAVYFYKSVSNFLTSRSNLAQTHKIINIAFENTSGHDKYSLLDEVAVNQEIIDTNQVSKDKWHLISSLGLLASASSLIYGGVKCYTTYVNYGYIGVASSVAIGIINYSCHRHDEKYFEDCKNTIVENAKKLMKQFNKASSWFICF